MFNFILRYIANITSLAQNISRILICPIAMPVHIATPTAPRLSASLIPGCSIVKGDVRYRSGRKWYSRRLVTFA